ncbi:MAG TPA: pantetheine-phosphate adenylyltransferase [Gammaproteobacteria bacterium]|nr:pantetheine-phosphate adenylyltransferase [Gammaproteobacteria bacterium]
MKITAIYPGTFDPITRGHCDIAKRAAGIFDKVLVAVAESTTKHTLFTAEERVQLAKDSLASVEHIEVCSFDSLVVDLAREYEARVIIRGVRAASDFDHEFQMAGMNQQLYDRAETIFLTPNESLRFISSSLVREIASLGGDVSQFVHECVLKALQKKLKQEN